MNIIETKLDIGAVAPFKVIHLSDTHLTYADMRDGDRKVLLARDRVNCFPEAEKVLAYACKLSDETNAPIIHTGDLIDFVSFANIERVKKFTDMNDCFMAAGNHEFSLYLGEAKEDAAYRNKSLDMVQNAFKNDIRMSSRVINGVNFVALDNGYYLFEPEQFDFLKSEVKKNLPIVLMLHTPIYEKALYDVSIVKGNVAYLAGVPDELMAGYPPDRYVQQKADDLTLEVIRYIEDEALIKAIITGHLHFSYEGKLVGRITQLVNGCTDVRIISVI